MAKTERKTQAQLDAEYHDRRNNVAPKIKTALAKVNKRRKARALKSFYAFMRTYAAGAICDYPPPPEMKPILGDMERVALAAGKYQILMTRGLGKTTDITGLAVYLLVKSLFRFIEIIGSTKDKAVNIFDTMTAMFTAEPFATDFPEVAVPWRMSGGNSIRMSRMTYDGTPIDMEKTGDHMILPKIPGCGYSAAKIVTRGITSNDLRGLNLYGERPDLVILDDIQSEAKKADPVGAAELMNIVTKVVGRQFAHHKDGTMLMTATPLFSGDLTDIIRNDPSWVTKVYPMMVKMPTNIELWEQYRDVLHAETAALAVDRKPEQTARAFYLAHRAALDEGAEPLSPHLFNRKREASAIQHAMNILYTDGEAVFKSECQMEPQSVGSVYEISYKTILARVNGVPMGVVPRGIERLVATVDVMNEAGLRYAIVGFGQHRTAAVVGYGRFPADGRPIYPKTAKPDEKDSALAAALNALLSQFATAVYARQDGGVMRIGAVGVDAGWQTRVGHIEAAKFHEDWVTMLKGQSWKDFGFYTPSGKLRPNVIAADEWAGLVRGQYGRDLLFHADHWRETSQRSWFLEPLQPGSLSVFGNTPDVHFQFANEAVADRLVAKDKLVSGGEVWKWVKTSPANHLGDCLTMAYALAYWKRQYVTAATEMDTRAAPPGAHPRSRNRRTVCL